MRFLRAVSLYMIAALICSCPGMAQTLVQIKEYQIAFSTPAGYHRPAQKEIPVEAAKAIYVAIGPQTNQIFANINISTGRAPVTEMTPALSQEVAAGIKQQMGARYEEFVIVSQKNTVVGGVPAFDIVMELRAKNAPHKIRNRQIYLIKGGWVFVVNFMADASAFAKESRAFDGFVKSVRFSEAKATR